MTDQALSLQQLNRTFIGSVLFIDIVGYSRGTVPEQIAMKDIFNRLLREAVQNVAPGDRIMVDTGDGAGVAFLGDPEDALFAALSLRDAIDAGEVGMGEPGFVRMGINLGPLKMVRDINGHTNMIGDAVNDAQRVMSFADPGQVMVSHSYYDIISRFSVDYAKLFSYEGARHDKHVREHQVYSFGPNAGTEILTEKLRDRSRARNPNSIMPTHFDTPDDEAGPATIAAAAATAAAAVTLQVDTISPTAASPVQLKPVPAANVKTPRPPSTATTGKKGMTGRLGMMASVIVCVAGVAAGGAAWYLHVKSAAAIARNGAMPALPGTSQVAVKPDNKTAQLVASSPAPAQMMPKVADPTPTTANKTAPGSPTPPLAPGNGPAAPMIATQAAVANNVQKPGSTPVPSSAPAMSVVSAANTAGAGGGKPADIPAPKPGTVSLSIEPWGEVFVDGASSGISPPLKSLKLAPGKHKIEIHNSDFAPYKKTVQVKSDVDIAVHYVF